MASSLVPNSSRNAFVPAHLRLCAVSLGIPAVAVVNQLVPVRRNAHQKLVLCQKRNHLIAQVVAVGLQRVADGNAACVVLLLQLDESIKKADASKRRLDSLKYERCLSVSIGHASAHDRFQRFCGHDGIERRASVLHFVSVEAILTPHVACA